jgi:hypothetical protein
LLVDNLDAGGGLNVLSDAFKGKVVVLVHVVQRFFVISADCVCDDAEFNLLPPKYSFSLRVTIKLGRLNGGAKTTKSCIL